MARVGAELRRQDFVEATVRVIAEHGVANATTRRIAAAADCPLASLHYVFHTKDDLFYAVYESLFNMPQEAMEHIPAGATPAETVAEVLRQLIEWFTTNPEMARTQSELFL
ncbi:HTH-type transcriptional regulator BetI [compost metagenome]